MYKQGRHLSEYDSREFVGIEEGLRYANSQYIAMNKTQAEINRKIAEHVIKKLVKLMCLLSPTLRCLYKDLVGAGSVYEGLKITKPDEFDIDILMQLPEDTEPRLLENNIPGYVNLQLQNFQSLQFDNPTVYKEMQTFIDEKNYLLTKKMKAFMQSIIDRTVKEHFPDVIEVDGRRFKIRLQDLGPAFTITLERRNFRVCVDLVPCILLDGGHWPGGAFTPNPYTEPSDFFLVPKSPKKELPHIERYWRLSFQKQEVKMIFDRQWMKPTIRIMKRLRDHFGHKVSSYALKTMFFQQLKRDNPAMDEATPELWLGPWSYAVVYMLQLYLKYLLAEEIPYFWNDKLNLLDHLTPQQFDHYRRQIQDVIDNITIDPTPETVLKYLQSVQV